MPISACCGVGWGWIHELGSVLQALNNIQQCIMNSVSVSGELQHRLLKRTALEMAEHLCCWWMAFLHGSPLHSFHALKEWLSNCYSRNLNESILLNHVNIESVFLGAVCLSSCSLGNTRAAQATSSAGQQNGMIHRNQTLNRCFSTLLLWYFSITAPTSWLTGLSKLLASLCQAASQHMHW